MKAEQTENQIARRSAMIYLTISLGAGLLFLLATGWSLSYLPVARLGGAVWVTLLTLIVSMPLVISREKRKYPSRQEADK